MSIADSKRTDGGISIVIMTYGRVELLRELLDSIKVAVGRTDFPTEIILVDNSTPKDKILVEALAKEHGAIYDFRDICLAAKRNYGVRISHYEILLFLDSDCRVSPNILLEYHKVYDKHPDCSGSCGPLEFEGPDTWFWKVVEKTPYGIFFQTALWGSTFTWAPTANFSVKKEAFLRAGGFDEDFPKKPGGEDIDLGLRMTGTGAHMYTAPDALVYHSKSTWGTFSQMFERVFHYGAADALLVEKYPEMTCSSLLNRVIMILIGMVLFLFWGFTVNRILLFGVVFTPLYQILCNSFAMNAFCSYKRTSFLKQCLVQILDLSNQIGYIKGCFSLRHPSLLSKKMIFFKSQMDGVGYQYVFDVAIYLVYLLLVFLAVYILK